MRALIRKTVNKLGLDIVKIPKSDINLYHNFPKDSIENKRMYNIGAGSFSHPYWTNVDYSTDVYSSMQQHPFINYDLMALQPLPIQENTAQIVYSSHTIEHVNDEAVLNLLKEAYRILKPNGTIRLTTPDADLEFQAYLKNDLSFWYWRDNYSQPGQWEKLYYIPMSKASIHQLFLNHYASQLSEINTDDIASKKYSDAEIAEIFTKNPCVETLDYFTKQCKFNPNRPNNHINWWNYEKIFSFLKDAGFSTIYRSAYGQSLCAPLRNTSLFDSTHPKISLYVEAIKS